MIVTSPNFRIRNPVNTPGANIAKVCQAITLAVAAKLWPQIEIIAMGVAVIKKFITVCPTVAEIAAAIKTGCLMIFDIGRCSPLKLGFRKVRDLKENECHCGDYCGAG